MRALLSTAEAAELIERRALVVLDVRWRLTGPPARPDYESAHLPGAVFLDLDTELAGPPGPGLGRHPLPAPGTLVETFRRAGVGNGVPVLVYDDADGSVAARAWWLLRWLDHQAVAVLDGGFAAWRAEGRAVTDTVPEPVPARLDASPGAMPLIVADDATVLAARGRLLDARLPQRYRGETEPVDARPGHIPGAENSPVAVHTDEQGRWRAPDQLAAHFASLGVTEATQVGAYCGSGVNACATVLAMEHAGFKRTPGLYAGSYSQWSADPNRAVATGG